MLLLAGEALLMARNESEGGSSSEISSKYFLAAAASPAGSLTAKAAEVVEQGRCAMSDSLEAHDNALKSMYRALRRELGLTVTPPKGSTKESL